MPTRTTRKKVPRPKARRSAGGSHKLRPRITGAELMDRLAEVARIGALFIEGEDCINALMPESRTWTKADDINYDASVGVPLKKTLLRIEQIGSFTCYAILWRRRPDTPDRVEVILAGRMNSPYDLGKGKCPPIFPALKQVFDRGLAAAAATSDPVFETHSAFRYGPLPVRKTDKLLKGGKHTISYFLPIRDSREDVVAALEIACAVLPV